MVVKRKLLPKERNFIDYCEKLFFSNQNKFPSVKEASVYLGYSETEIQYFLENQTVIDALEGRGIAWKHGKKDLTPTQVAAAILVMNFADPRPMEQKLKEIGVTGQQYMGWLQSANFREYISSLASRNLDNIRPTVIANFTRAIERGDWRAIKFYLEVTGEFATQSNTLSVEVVKALVQKMVEIIQTHVTDTSVLNAISKDMFAAVSFMQPDTPQEAITAEVEDDTPSLLNTSILGR